jgi:maltose phosphorylase
VAYTAEVIGQMEKEAPSALSQIVKQTNFNTTEELKAWQHLTANVFMPVNKDLGIVLQQENYLDKEQKMASDLNLAERPINQHWSWDRILRSCFIKQADVLQGMYFFEDDFKREEIERNFDFYEPRTLHESSLSPCVHVVTAAYLDKMDTAYDLYLRTSRLDLDDYNREVHEGLHITSMAGTWLSVIEGFGGMRIKDNKPSFTPKIPNEWEAYTFKINFRENIITVKVTQKGSSFHLEGQREREILVNNEIVQLINGKTFEVS